MSNHKNLLGVLILIGSTTLHGCAHSKSWSARRAAKSCDQGCEHNVELASCEDGSCGGCKGCGSRLSALEWKLFGWLWKKSNAIPDTLPLGSTVLAHDQVMETNAEAADFIIHMHEFVGQTAQLTPNGKDHILEIASRMRSTPFPVIVEREPNNSDPELDALRRNLIAQILTDLGNQDAQQRTVVGLPYGPGYVSRRGEQMYYQHHYNGGMGNNFGATGGVGGGFGGGGFGGGGGGW